MRFKTIVCTSLAAAVLAAVAACESPTPTTPVDTSSQSPAPSASASPGAPDGTFFRDDFDGTALDEGRWKAFAQTGLILVKDGKLDLLNVGPQPNFPYLVTRDAIIPETGPFYFEMSYTFMAQGRLPAFCLDYLPPESPGVAGLTTPFLRTTISGPKLGFIVDHEEKDVVATTEGPGYALNEPHVIRLECDAEGNYRLIFDGKEVALFKSQRRPTKFWIGDYPQRDIGPATWPRLAVDYVAAGVLTTPAAAEPMPTPIPTPTPEPSASPKP